MSDERAADLTGDQVLKLLFVVLRLPTQIDLFFTNYFSDVSPHFSAVAAPAEKFNALLGLKKPSEIYNALLASEPDAVKSAAMGLSEKPGSLDEVRADRSLIFPKELFDQIIEIASRAEWPQALLLGAYALTSPKGATSVPPRDATVPLVVRLLRSLGKSVRNSDSIHPVLAFVWHLMTIAGEVNSPDELNRLSDEISAWFQKAASFLQVDPAMLDKLKARVEEDVRSLEARELYLALVLRASTRGDYCVSAWRVLVSPVTISWKDEDAELLDVEDRPYKLDEIPTLVNILIERLYGDLEQSNNKLTVEMFVPLELLCCDADQWGLRQGTLTTPLGTEYRVVIRSWNRSYDGGWWSPSIKWKINGKRLLSGLGRAAWACAREHLTSDRSEVLLPVEEPLGVALKFSPPSDETSGTYPVLQNLVSKGVPIAVWPRKDVEGSSMDSFAERLVSGASLESWREEVLQYRKEAIRSDDRAGHLGGHLTILWDDPNKLLPDALRKARGQQVSKG